jgi:hypothetical protein
MKKKLNVKFWEVPQSNNFDLPEVSDPNLAYEVIKDRPSCGIAFSGGGTVSAALAPGFLKALEDLGIMKNVKYISGVSGGTWGTAPYCYSLNAEKRKNYFGFLTKDLTKLNLKKLEEIPKKDSMTHAVTNAEIVKLTLTSKSYTKAVGKIFLAPFGLNDEKKYFTTDEKALENIIGRNPHLSSKDFYLLYNDPSNPKENNSPYYIMNAIMLIPPKKCFKKHTQLPFEFTSLYSGMKHTQEKGRIGGFYVESFGFNTTSPKKTGDTYVSVPSTKNPFTLHNPVGTSGSALEAVLANTCFLKRYLPAFYYWNDSNIQPQHKANKYLYGDGGILEDTGLSSLLLRKINNIVLFITEPFDITPISNRKCEKTQRIFGYNQIARLFGADTYKKNKFSSSYFLKSPVKNRVQFFEKKDFEGLSKELMQCKKDGKPIIVTQSYIVKENKRFGIEGGNSVNVTWVVVDACKDFNTNLPTDVYNQQKNKFQLSSLNNFPALCAFKQNKHKAIELTLPQANLLANQAYWMTRHSDSIKKALS